LSLIADFINATITELIFVDPGWRCIASITAMSCCLRRCLQQSNLSPLRHFCLSEDSVRAHPARDTMQLLYQETSASSVLTSGRQTVQIWTPSTTRSGKSCSSVY